MWEFLSQNLRNKISVTDFFCRIWGMRETNTNSKLEYRASIVLVYTLVHRSVFRRIGAISDSSIISSIDRTRIHPGTWYQCSLIYQVGDSSIPRIWYSYVLLRQLVLVPTIRSKVPYIMNLHAGVPPNVFRIILTKLGPKNFDW